jgi:hypothetical protein
MGTPGWGCVSGLLECVSMKHILRPNGECSSPLGLWVPSGGGVGKRCDVATVTRCLYRIAASTVALYLAL